MESIPSMLVTRDVFWKCGKFNRNPTQPMGIHTGNRSPKPVKWKVTLCCHFNSFSCKELATASSSFMASIRLRYLEIVSVIFLFTQHHPTSPFDVLFFFGFCHVLYVVFWKQQMLFELSSLQVSAINHCDTPAVENVKMSPHMNCVNSRTVPWIQVPGNVKILCLFCILQFAKKIVDPGFRDDNLSN